MKKAVICILSIYCALCLILPLGKIISGAFGYSFELFDYGICAIFLAAFSVCAFVLTLVLRADALPKAVRVILNVSAPLSGLNALFFFISGNGPVVFFSMAICVILPIVMLIIEPKPLPMFITSLALASALLAINAFPALFSLIEFRSMTTVASKESPSGAYVAEIIDDDQGALGGATRVKVHEKDIIDAGLFIIKPEPKEIYYGKWGEAFRMKIDWKDDETLVINGKEYSVK